jgi:hypothetical protein
LASLNCSAGKTCAFPSYYLLTDHQRSKPSLIFFFLFYYFIVIVFASSCDPFCLLFAFRLDLFLLVSILCIFFVCIFSPEIHELSLIIHRLRPGSYGKAQGLTVFEKRMKGKRAWGWGLQQIGVHSHTPI